MPIVVCGFLCALCVEAIAGTPTPSRPLPVSGGEGVQNAASAPADWSSAWLSGSLGRDCPFFAPGEEMAFSIRLEGVKGGIPSGEHFIDWEPRVFFMGGAAVAPETLRPGTEPADYDAVFAAKRVKCPVETSCAGLGDYVSPPSSLAVLYNVLRVPKKITWRQGWTHGWSPDGMAKWTVDGGFDETLLERNP